MHRLPAWLCARLRISKGYGTAALAVLAIEAFIALALHDDFIRPYVGDTLAVVLLYCMVLAVLELPRAKVALGALGVALIVELAQAFALVDRLGLVEGDALRVILGSQFDLHDVVAYTAALPLLALAERAATSRCRCTA